MSVKERVSTKLKLTFLKTSWLHSNRYKIGLSSQKSLDSRVTRHKPLPGSM